MQPPIAVLQQPGFLELHGDRIVKHTGDQRLYADPQRHPAALFLADNATGDNAIFLGSALSSSNLGAGASTSRSARVTLPAFGSGQKFLVVRVDANRSFVVADIPGLIEGAAEGAGLGHQFLRHLQRTHLLLHIVDIAPFDPGADPARDARAILEELRKYDAGLFEKPRWLVANKIDLLPEGERAARLAALIEGYGPVDRHFAISAISGAGCRELTFAIMEHIESRKAAAEAAAPSETQADETED